MKKQDRQIVEISYQIDLTKITDDIASSDNLENDRDVFAALSAIEVVKHEFKLAEKKIEEIEKQVKTTIDARARKLYGNHWTVIKDSEDRYKIIKVPTGPVFEASDKAPDEFLKAQISVNTEAVESFIKDHSKLPKGISYNGVRGQSIRISVKDTGVE